MIINTHYYGSVEYTEEELVTFPEGLFGFSDLKQYLPLGLDDGDGSLLLLQSIENPDIAFFLINPPAILPDYCPALQPEELDFLQVSSSDELSYYSICVVRSNYLENTVNLKCPLAINPSTRRGMQIILSGNQYGYRHPLGDLLGNVDQEGDIGYADSETQKKGGNPFMENSSRCQIDRKRSIHYRIGIHVKDRNSINFRGILFVIIRKIRCYFYPRT